MISIKIFVALILLVVFSLVFPSTSYAYLDPGSGSFLLQMIIAGLIAASFAIKTFWRNIKNFFTNLFKKKK